MDIRNWVLIFKLTMVEFPVNHKNGFLINEEN